MMRGWDECVEIIKEFLLCKALLLLYPSVTEKCMNGDMGSRVISTAFPCSPN